MTDERWGAVDRYIGDLFIGRDDALAAALDASEAAGLPKINVSATTGKLLYLLAAALRARRILEIGTLGGYSTIWLARALPADGRLVTLELEPRHAEVARANLARAGLDRVVEVKVGRALETLRTLQGPFDLVFIDADKEGYPDYLERSIALSRPGTLIVADNVIRQGQVIDPANEDPRVRAVRRFNEVLARDARVSAIEVQTVGSKGYDGLAFALVR